MRQAYYYQFGSREYTMYTYAASPAIVEQIARQLGLPTMPFGLMLHAELDPNYGLIADTEVWYTFDEPYERKAVYYPATILSYTH